MELDQPEVPTDQRMARSGVDRAWVLLIFFKKFKEIALIWAMEFGQFNHTHYDIIDIISITMDCTKIIMTHKNLQY
jgi:hypothetical protein